jgi:3-hydroxyisobutyrate dehydrogenase
MTITIGFIGLGKMGTPMVQNLLNQGYPVRVYDLVPESIAHCAASGAIAANSPVNAVEGADVVFTMLQTGDQVKAICLGDEGIFQRLKPGALYIDSSSIDIDSTRLLHERAEQQNIAMLDAPVSGGVAGAAAGTLTIMAGGKPADFERGKPFLQALGKFVFHAGAAGNGQAAKICNNLILGISMIAVSEGFTLAEKLGLDPKTFLEISSHSSGECWVMTHYNPVPGVLENVPANHQYQPGFTSAMMLKDLKLSQNAAEITGVTTELGAKATQLYQHFVDSNHGNLDFSAIINIVKV